MSNFKTPLVVSPLPDGKHWKLHTAFSADIPVRGSLYLHITVPAGFITDFASVPWPFWSFIRPWGKWGKAAVLHDYLYQERTGAYRSTADMVFLNAMKLLWRTTCRQSRDGTSSSCREEDGGRRQTPLPIRASRPLRPGGPLVPY